MRVLEEGLPDRAGDRLVDVLADQVGELEGAHRGSRRHSRSTASMVAGSAARSSYSREGLGVEGAGDPVDDEARGVGAAHRRLAPGGGGVVRARRGGLASVAEPETTSTSGSSGAGLKKCRPTKRPGCAGRRAMAVTDREEVLVASRQSSPTSPSSAREQLLLDVQPLDDRLDDQAAVGEVGESGDGRQPGACARRGRRRRAGPSRPAGRGGRRSRRRALGRGRARRRRAARDGPRPARPGRCPGPWCRCRRRRRCAALERSTCVVIVLRSSRTELSTGRRRTPLSRPIVRLL